MAVKSKKKATKKTAAKQFKKPAAQCATKRAKKPAPRAQKPSATSTRKAPVNKSDIYAGATEVTMTKNKIAVTRTVSKKADGRYEKREIRTYHNRTPARERALDEKLKKTAAEKFTVKFQ